MITVVSSQTKPFVHIASGTGTLQGSVAPELLKIPFLQYQLAVAAWQTANFNGNTPHQTALNAKIDAIVTDISGNTISFDYYA